MLFAWFVKYVLILYQIEALSESTMSNKSFYYQEPFPLKKDDTVYYLLSRDYVSVAEFAGQEVLKVDPEALTLLAQHAFHNASFMLSLAQL